ncbi:hypothetical protein O6H91_08G065400 [Diphasiastrum complanatum]|uniref:Uncharacterized protein n=1 Tax=Diphasiastrum complanatum TaxID=34168 RepID=A0ACC2CYI0_DIPCM|nr:hypothetical protein O6H91_08G065400 [Diphasiastrum complanatum]
MENIVDLESSNLTQTLLGDKKISKAGCIFGLLRAHGTSIFTNSNFRKKNNNDENPESRILRNATSDKLSVVKSLQSNLNGLVIEEAKERLQKYGQNVLSCKRASPWYSLLWNAFWHPFNVILLVLGAISAATGDKGTLFVMCLMVALSVGVRFYQELKSSRAATRLADLVKYRATVIRREFDYEKIVEMEIPQEDVVPGDVVVLRSGDLFPGDIRLLTSTNLYVSQSALTGESIPVEKTADVIEDISTPVFDMRNVGFMGTSVESGEGLGVVFSTGDNTYISTIAGMLGNRNPTNAFQKGVRQVSYMLILFMLAMVPIVIVISGFTTHNWGGSFLFGISVAVGLTPEMLPMIVNANLARGALAMAHKKCIVKRLDAIQNMGAMDILCTDKTGTLTVDHVAMAQHMDSRCLSKDRVLKYAYLNSYFQKGLKNPIDSAVLTFGDTIADKGNVDTSNYRCIAELPFDFTRRRLSVILKEVDDGGDIYKMQHERNLETMCTLSNERHVLVTKGALEEMLTICSRVQETNTIVAMTKEYREKLLFIGEELNTDGLRVVAVATKLLECTCSDLPASTESSEFLERDYSHEDENDMVFQGFITFQDPPKESAKGAINALSQKGISVKVLTGDTLAIAIKICKDVGIVVDHVTTGPRLALLDAAQFVEEIKKATVMAKLTPTQKMQVVEALKSANHTVGFIGDGINDSLALKAADVGISVDSATSVAKDAAQIILLEKDLDVLVAGVIRGRITHGNTIKYIKMAASSNFGNVFSILVASAWLPFDPMKPIQILTQNLLYDFSQASIPWDRMDSDYLEIPHQWSATGIVSFMIFMGPISSVFDIATFLLLWFGYGVCTPEQQALFQTCWFLEGLLTQTLVIHMLRTRRIPFLEETASWPVLLTTATIVGIGLAIPFTLLGATEMMAKPPISYFGFLAVIVLSYCCLAQLVKGAYIKIFGKWL